MIFKTNDCYYKNYNLANMKISIHSTLVLLLSAYFISFICSAKTKYFGLDSRVRHFNSYKIRQAQLSDIPAIKTCNELNLNENYSLDFFDEHLMKWPKLCIVCEDINKNIVAYALARVVFSDTITPITKETKANEDCRIVSIAVNNIHRGKKIATELMRFLHVQLELAYDPTLIDLQCRVSTSSILYTFVS